MKSCNCFPFIGQDKQGKGNVRQISEHKTKFLLVQKAFYVTIVPHQCSISYRVGPQQSKSKEKQQLETNKPKPVFVVNTRPNDHLIL